MGTVHAFVPRAREEAPAIEQPIIWSPPSNAYYGYGNGVKVVWQIIRDYGDHSTNTIMSCAWRVRKK